MTNHVLLNNIEHKDLKVIADRSAEYGDGVMLALLFPVEFRRAQADYPIFFHKNSDTGEFVAVALFGFREAENLYLNDSGWDAAYIPLTVERQPFLIGLQKRQSQDGDQVQRMIHIDLDNPRVSQSQGEPLFLELGGSAPYLERMKSVLEAIDYGYNDGKSFIKALVEFELIEPFSLNATLRDGSPLSLQGFYTINEDRLRALNGDAFAQLNADGHLDAIYMAVASQSNIEKLIAKKNESL